MRIIEFKFFNWIWPSWWKEEPRFDFTEKGIVAQSYWKVTWRLDDWISNETGWKEHELEVRITGFLFRVYTRYAS